MLLFRYLIDIFYHFYMKEKWHILVWPHQYNEYNFLLVGHFWFDFFFKIFQEKLNKMYSSFNACFPFLCTETRVSWFYQMRNYDTYYHLKKLFDIHWKWKNVKLKNPHLFICKVFRNTITYGSFDCHEAWRVIFSLFFNY